MIYEEGEFSPKLEGPDNEGEHVYTTQIGYYIRQNNVVFITLETDIAEEDIDDTWDGEVRISNLPFSVDFPGITGVSFVRFSTINYAGTPVGIVAANLIRLATFKEDGTGRTFIETKDIDGRIRISLSGTYIIN